MTCGTELESINPIRTRLRAVLTTADGRPVAGQEITWTLPAPLFPQGVRSPQNPNAEPSRTDGSGAATVLIGWPAGMPVNANGTATASFAGGGGFGPSNCTVQVAVQST
jgi:hypothetical protein